MDWIRKAPTPVVVAVIVSVGVILLGVLTGFVVLQYSGKPTDDYVRLVNTLANLLMLPLGGLAAVASVSAAKSASKAEDQTNGHLTARDVEIDRLRGQVAILKARGR